MTSKQNLAIGSQGRPTLYSDDLGTRLCELLAEGDTLSSICKEHPDLPSERTIRRWALDPEHPFSPQYARAREVGYHKMADDLLDIADGEVTEPGQVARDRLRTDSRKWLLSKALPKVYGDKLAIGGDPDTGPVKHIIEHVYVRPEGN